MTSKATGQGVRADVVIAGGGLVGLTLALALGRAGLDVAVVDREPPARAADDRFDGRASAIALGSARVLQGLGLWPRLEPHAQPIEDIRVSDGDSLLFVHYDHRDLGGEPLGYIIENRFIRRALYAAIGEATGVRLAAAVELAALERGRARVVARLSDGRKLEGRVAIACDGRGSPLRAAAGIRVVEWHYPQTGIVCSVAHERAHDGVAHERFL